MQISSANNGLTPAQMQQLLASYQASQTQSTGQTLPGGSDAADETGQAAGQAAPPAPNSAIDQFASATLASLLGVQQGASTNGPTDPLDTNGDGVVSQAELQAGQQTQKAHHGHHGHHGHGQVEAANSAQTTEPSEAAEATEAPTASIDVTA